MDQHPINLQYTTIKAPLPDFIYESLSDYSKTANAYHPQPQELVSALARKHAVPSEMIYLTAGIDEAIHMFALSFGSNAFVFTPTYIVYADVEEFGGKLTRIDSVKGSAFEIDPSTIPNASLIFLANPNNPSGITPNETVITLIKNNPHAKVDIDEAYGDFADLSVIDQVETFPQLVVLRSFSKGFAMAGNRVGYIIAHPNVINVVKNKAQWSNVSWLSVGAALAALKHEDYFIQMRSSIGDRRKDFREFLTQMGFAILPSKINAVLLKFVSVTQAESFLRHLTSNNVIVSHGNGASNIGLDKSYVRIAIGSDVQMKKLKYVITQYKA